MNREKIPEAYLNFIRQVGEDFSLIQGLGGNCSVKFGSQMFVKSSGKRMRDVGSPDFFHEVRLIGDGGFEDDVSTAPTRPSIEVFLHAAIKEKYVLHVHSTAAIAVSMKLASNPNESKRFSSNGILLLPYMRPGRELMLGILGAETQRTLGLLLGNHGLLVADNSVLGLYRRLKRIEKTLWEWIEHEGTKKSSIFSDYLDEQSKSEIVWHMRHNWRVTPDHVVFLGSFAPKELLTLTDFCSVTKYLAAMGSALKFTQVQLDQLRWYLQLARSLGPKQLLGTLTAQEAEFLKTWQPELLRKAMSGEN
ncbi:MAG: class II aldolase/adducin family protein [Rhodoluna sp.]